MTYETVDDPILKSDTDVLLKVTATAICGSDLHMYSGDFSQLRPIVLGHEFMGIVEEKGKGVDKGIILKGGQAPAHKHIVNRSVM